MKKRLFKIFTLLVIAIMAIKVQAQELKFTKSFRSKSSLFKGMIISEIPKDIQTKYGVNKNPGLLPITMD